MRSPRLTWPGFILFSLLAAAIFSQRVYQPIDIGEGQPAVVELLPPFVALLAAAVTVRARGRNLAHFVTRGFLLMWAPYLLLTLILPILGVAIGDYPLRGLASVRTSVVAMSAIILGAEVRRLDHRGLRAWSGPLLIGGLLVAGYALLQQLIVANLLPRGPWDLLQAWDLATQEVYGRGLVLGRSSAFYTNPSILGAWAGIALLIATVAIDGWRRNVVIAAALGSLVLSQSRGATLGLVAALVFLGVRAVRRHRALRLRALTPFMGAVTAVIAVWAILAVAGAPVAELPARIFSGFGYLLGGQDPNAAGRLEFWRAGLELLRTHPFGTLGPPEVILGTAVDSEWVRALLQGGPLLLAALGVALLGGATGIWLYGPERESVRTLSVFIAVAGLTQIPLEYPPALLFWAMVGSSLAMAKGAPAGDKSGSHPEIGSAGAARDVGGPRLLMVTTIARTLEAFFLPHAAALADRGWTVDAMAHGIAKSGAAEHAFARCWEIGWSRRPISLGNLAAIGRVRAVAAAGRYDIIHVHTPVAAFVTRFALRRVRTRPAVIYTAHGFHFHENAGWIRNVVYGSLEHLAGRWTDELVVVNHEDYEAASRDGLLPSGRIHQILGAGFDPGRYESDVSPPAVAEARREAGVPPGLPIVVAVAELNRNKNLGFLLSGFARMQKVGSHLVIVGEGPERDALARLARRLRIEGRAHMLGRVPDLRPILAAASAFALVSRREGLPNSMIEAMSMGVPVIGTDTRGIRDLAGDGRGILVPLGDADALARGLDTIISDRTAATMAAERARTYVRSELGIGRIIAEYLALYDAVLARRAKAATWA